MFYEKPLPFYLSYPMPLGMMEERIEERERELLKSYYSATVTGLQEIVEQECDRMDYEGSMMYDEYPDRFMMERLCRRICDRYREDHPMEEEPMETMENREPGRDHGRHRGNRLEDLVSVLLSHEIYRRRCRRRRCRRFY
ncbi:MAG: hypothetical protein SOT28_00875 [Fusicatenibacter sp.]|nr:hypothetical protein [Lachnospiraceae bacterium]MDY2936860.1 hypothetical protein [Fusicatenibacter sp.]